MATNHSPLTYTQETLFEQAIGGPIAALWQTRQEGFVKGTEKKKIYWCKLTNPEHKKAVLIVNGRIESSWKYQELFYDLYRQGYDVYSFDHRGQGLSDRLLSDSDMGHVYDFTDYIDDMDVVIKQHDLKQYQQCFIIAHSMGGAIATRYLQTHPEHPFTGLILSAPMFGINLPWYLSPIAIPVTQILSAVSPLPRYAPGHKPYFPKPFEDNPLSQSAGRYQWFRNLYTEKPELQVGGPSTRWVWQGLMAAKQCFLLTRQVKVPVLLVQAGNDRIVSNLAQKRFIEKLRKTNPHAALLSIEGAQHEILFETDQYRNQALDAIFRFMDDPTSSSDEKKQ
ncbi:alpha/beta fold hydrolase [Vibrio parahaemolyticus]|uniref:alpha/beta fold hydrolase n=1 Tax=Vibrio parahaemolyticus TaxID=670 RepID=UPI001121D99B|nr:alpha/beta fold hydrolase [Vibrio parahaemolyticus]EGR2783931.1 alpha/beta fold hydrolase [Vibrio parahaemolyticus]EJC6733204.1 alpha/beta fold hydrolase [Vibrio parahaemolyticus]EJC6946571.1 alpha/beta fold hydrolase [Vibrio parahaemolyticus]EJC7032605.1 alpha/beta fold hydrolase [Vibrio parahaemolyticus]EJC7071539.1 alpha/beta fold hydrolase [Vibrio parahaemolyticus]